MSRAPRKLEATADLPRRLDCRVRLRDVQETPELLLAQTSTVLAWLTHEAEHCGDDITFLAIQDIIEQRPRLSQELYREEYLRTWPEHAKARGYHKQPNAPLTGAGHKS